MSNRGASPGGVLFTVICVYAVIAWLAYATDTRLDRIERAVLEKEQP